MIWRALLWCFPRFLVLLVILTMIQQFDFSPLPAWTAILVAYSIHFLLTYMAARWSFHRDSPTRQEVAGVTLTILVFGTLLEAIFFLFFHPWKWSLLFANYRWQSLYLIALYIIAILLAAKHARQKNRRTGLPEGVTS